MRSELRRTLKDLNGRKAPGIDGIPAELLRSTGKEAIDRFYKLGCNIYEIGKVPSYFKKSVIVIIPKKAGENKCEDY